MRRAVEEPREFDVVELVGDETILPRLLLREEVVRFQTFLHLQKRLQILLGDFPFRGFERLAKGFVESLLIDKGDLLDVRFIEALDVLAVTDVVVVSFDGVFEEIVVFFGKVFLYKAFEIAEIFLVSIVDLGFRLGDALGALHDGDEARAVGKGAYFQNDLRVVAEGGEGGEDRVEFVVSLSDAK